MDTALAMESLQIRGFRAFDDLRVPRLGRINLFVGKNNVGKSSILESLWLYASQGHPSIIWQILEARGEGRPPRPGRNKDNQRPASVLKNLFYGRQEIRRNVGSIRIGPVDSEDKLLTISVGWYPFQTDYKDAGPDQRLFLFDEDVADLPVLAAAIRFGNQTEIFYRLDRHLYTSQETERERCVLVGANGITAVEIGQLWDGIALTDLEEDVLESLRIISPEIERLSLISNPSDQERIPIAKTSSIHEPIPLRSLGEGMNRLFGVALALVNSRGGLLLLDEVESGLHYSVQPDVWRLVFKTAHRLNVQVFATTHSMDCIEAFQRAAEENEDEGVLIRLENENGLIVATEFDERRLGIATREEIEVR